MAVLVQDMTQDGRYIPRSRATPPNPEASADGDLHVRPEGRGDSMHRIVDQEGVHAGAALAAATLGGLPTAPTVGRDAVGQAYDFAEALHQAAPLVPRPGHAAVQAAELVAESTARVRGLLPETAYRLVTSPRELLSFITGRHPAGKTAEIVVARDFRELHAGGDPQMQNGPKGIATNVVDVRLSPDSASRRDLLFQVQTRGGALVVAGGQVKTGSGQYVSASLVEMAMAPGYGRTGYVDQRFVNPDGTPRVAPDAFTEGQARRLREAGVQLRGIRDLDARARKLVENIVHHAEDGLDPVTREELFRLREDVVLAYEPGGVATRASTSAAVAAATSALVNLVVQYATSGTVHVPHLQDAALTAATWGAGSVTADAVLYHAATEMGLAPEAAQAFARHAVAAGCCLLAIAGDAAAEARALREGRTTILDAVAGTSFKTALGLLPLVLPPLGLAGAPLLVALQVGGRWSLAALRQRDAALARAISEDLEAAAKLKTRLSDMGEAISNLSAECDETDRLFEETMGRTTRPQFRLVTGNGG
jgi:hypothetical protein